MESKSYSILFGGGGELVYQYEVKFCKWTFRVGSWTFLQRCRGIETAHKVARIIVGSYKRSGELDNLARNNISRLISSQQSAY